MVNSVLTCVLQLMLFSVGFAIKQAFEESQRAEASFRAAITKLVVVRGHSDSFLFDDFRLKAENCIDKSQNMILPKPEQEVLELAKAYVIAARTFRDAVYFTIAQDRGHAGRAHVGNNNENVYVYLTIIFQLCV
jgi:hypothetical protein